MLVFLTMPRKPWKIMNIQFEPPVTSQNQHFWHPKNTPMRPTTDFGKKRHIICFLGAPLKKMKFSKNGKRGEKKKKENLIYQIWYRPVSNPENVPFLCFFALVRGL